MCGVSWILAGREGLSREAGEKDFFFRHCNDTNTLWPSQQILWSRSNECLWSLIIRTAALGRPNNAMVILLSFLIDPSPDRQADSIYRIPLKSPAAMARELKANAKALEEVLEGVNVKHPLVSIIILSVLE